MQAEEQQLQLSCSPPQHPPSSVQETYIDEQRIAETMLLGELNQQQPEEVIVVDGKMPHSIEVDSDFK